MTDLEKAKEWLGRTVCEQTGYDDWDGAGPDGRENYISDTWAALVAVHGEESAKMVLLSKWSDVKGGEK